MEGEGALEVNSSGMLTLWDLEVLVDLFSLSEENDHEHFGQLPSSNSIWQRGQFTDQC